MKYKELIEKIGKIVEDCKLLLRVQGDIICIDGLHFHVDTINRIQMVLQRYGECEWWILPSDTLANGVMYKIRIFN